MSRILFISDAHTPPLYGVRVRFFADFMAKRGHEVVLVSERYDESKEQRAKSKEQRTNNSYNHLAVRIYSANRTLKILQRVLVWLADMFFPCKECIFTRGVRKAIEDRKFDVVICSTFHSFPLLTAQTIANELGAKLVVDVRDMAEQMQGYVYHEYHPRWSHWLLALKQKAELRRRNEVLRSADALTTVSPWHVEQLRQYNPNATLIYNGYDSEEVMPRAEKQKKFEIVYLGKFYGEPLQNVSTFFRLMQNLIEDEGLDINLVFYTDDKSRARLSEHIPQNIADHTRFEDYVPRGQVPEILSKASAALVLTNEERPEGPHGMMTTKFFEALGAGVPVLCTRTNGGCLADVVNSTAAGITDIDTEKFCQYIRALYRQWQTTGMTHADTPDELRQFYNRQKQTEKLETVCGFK